MMMPYGDEDDDDDDEEGGSGKDSKSNASGPTPAAGDQKKDCK